jgi:hypothetical protein
MKLQRTSKRLKSATSGPVEYHSDTLKALASWPALVPEHEAGKLAKEEVGQTSLGSSCRHPSARWERRKWRMTTLTPGLSEQLGQAHSFEDGLNCLQHCWMNLGSKPVLFSLQLLLPAVAVGPVAASCGPRCLSESSPRRSSIRVERPHVELADMLGLLQ